MNFELKLDGRQNGGKTEALRMMALGWWLTGANVFFISRDDRARREYDNIMAHAVSKLAIEVITPRLHDQFPKALSMSGLFNSNFGPLRSLDHERRLVILIDDSRMFVAHDLRLLRDSLHELSPTIVYTDDLPTWL